MSNVSNLGNNFSAGDQPEGYGASDAIDLTFDFVLGGGFAVADFAAETQVGRFFGPVATAVLGSVDVIDAARNPTAQPGDLAVQTGGFSEPLGGR